MTYLMAVVSILGAILNVYKLRSGFILWIISNAYWTYHNYMIGEFAQTGIQFIYFCMAVWGVIMWSKKEE